MDEWLNTMWYIDKMAYYSAMRRKEILPSGINLERIMPSELNQTEKDKYCVVLFKCGI